MKWVRVDCEFDSHPDVLAAGFYAASLFLFVLRTSKRFDLGGAIPSKYVTSPYVTHHLGLSPEIWASAINDAVRVGLLEMDNEGNVTVPGWDNYNGDREVSQVREKAAERTRRWRERKNAKTASDVTRTTSDVTQRHGDDVTGTGRDGTEHDLEHTPPHPTGEDTPRKRVGVRQQARKESIDLTADGDWTGITDEHRDLLKRNYPGVNLDEELRKARAWAQGDWAKRRKVAWGRFLAGWLGRAQDKAATAAKQLAYGKPFDPNQGIVRDSSPLVIRPVVVEEDPDVPF